MFIYLLMHEYSFGGGVSESIIKTAFLKESAANHACDVMNQAKQDPNISYYVVFVECEQ